MSPSTAIAFSILYAREMVKSAAKWDKLWRMGKLSEKSVDRLMTNLPGAVPKSIPSVKEMGRAGAAVKSSPEWQRWKSQMVETPADSKSTLAYWMRSNTNGVPKLPSDVVETNFALRNARDGQLGKRPWSGVMSDYLNIVEKAKADQNPASWDYKTLFNPVKIPTLNIYSDEGKRGWSGIMRGKYSPVTNVITAPNIRSLLPTQRAQALATYKHELGHQTTIADPRKGLNYAGRVMPALEKIDPNFNRPFSTGGWGSESRRDAVTEAVGHMAGLNHATESQGGRALLNMPILAFRKNEPEVFENLWQRASELYGHKPLLRDRLMSVLAHLRTNYGIKGTELIDIT